MNFLAHLYLSGESDEIKVGNFIGDYVKGNKHLNYPDEIARGIRLHRRIDDFTDKHPLVRETINILKPGYGRYSGVIADVFFDHFLAANWNRFSEIPLPKFAEKVYATLLSRYVILPPRMKRMLPHMFTSNWLVYYGDANSFNHFFKGLARRTRFAPDLAKAAHQINEHYDELNADFLAFMDEMIPYVKNLKNI